MATWIHEMSKRATLHPGDVLWKSAPTATRRWRRRGYAVAAERVAAGRRGCGDHPRGG